MYPRLLAYGRLGGVHGWVNLMLWIEYVICRIFVLPRFIMELLGYRAIFGYVSRSLLRFLYSNFLGCVGFMFYSIRVLVFGIRYSIFGYAWALLFSLGVLLCFLCLGIIVAGLGRRTHCTFTSELKKIKIKKDFPFGLKYCFNMTFIVNNSARAQNSLNKLVTVGNSYTSFSNEYGRVTSLSTEINCAI